MLDVTLLLPRAFNYYHIFFFYYSFL